MNVLLFDWFIRNSLDLLITYYCLIKNNWRRILKIIKSYMKKYIRKLNARFNT